MAEAILKNKAISGIDAKSAGVYAISGMPASEQAQKVLEEQHISHAHQSSSLSNELVDWATHILTMTEGHKEAVINMFPKVKEKTYTLKEFAGHTADVEIMDPFGGSLEIYRQTYHEIQENIEEILKRLGNE